MIFAGLSLKVTRDRIMMKLASEFPEYGFQSHKVKGSYTAAALA